MPSSIEALRSVTTSYIAPLLYDNRPYIRSNSLSRNINGAAILAVIKDGAEYKIKANTSNHGYMTGDVVRVIGHYPGSKASYMTYGGYWTCVGVSPTDVVGAQYNVYGRDLEIPKPSREERIKAKKEEIIENEKRNTQLKAEIERLEKFKTDEEETAFLLVAASDGSKSPEERVAAIAKVLKDRLENKDTTDYI